MVNWTRPVEKQGQHILFAYTGLDTISQQADKMWEICHAFHSGFLVWAQQDSKFKDIFWCIIDLLYVVHNKLLLLCTYSSNYPFSRYWNFLLLFWNVLFIWSFVFLFSHQNVYRIHSVACTGNEAHLSACTMEFSKANSTAPCPNGGAAVVNCVPGPLFTQGRARRVKLNPMVIR